MANFVVVFIESKWHTLNLDNLNEYDLLDLHDPKIKLSQSDLIITFQTSDLIRHLGAKKVKHLPLIVDFESLDKQFSQEGKEFREFAKWKAVEALRYHKITDHRFELKYGTIRMFLEHLANLYRKLLDQAPDEVDRYINVELKINKIIYDRQLKGIKVDLEKAKMKCEELENRIYRLKNLLQLEYKIFSPENEQQQLNYILSKGYNLVNNFAYTFKVWRRDDNVANIFYELIRNNQDLDSIMFLIAQWGADRAMPVFNGFGTITSRITMRQPSLQNLRKSNRSIIIPDEGKKLLYVDYSQFEAGILASLSNEEYLINLYNNDIYEDIAENILNNKEKRGEAKIIFYRYMYGDSSLDIKSLEYFDQLRNLKNYKGQIKDIMSLHKKVGTSLGNFRHCFDDNFTWALSHIIQGTASLIYKNALLRVHENVKKVEFLIPMHDGTLYQVDEKYYEGCKKSVEKIYIEEFKKLCPLITPKVNFNEFSLDIEIQDKTVAINGNKYLKVG